MNNLDSLDVTRSYTQLLSEKMTVLEDAVVAATDKTNKKDLLVKLLDTHTEFVVALQQLSRLEATVDTEPTVKLNIGRFFNKK